MLFADIVERPDDSALDQTPERFDILRVDFATKVLALAVFYRRMRAVVHFKRLICSMLPR